MRTGGLTGTDPYLFEMISPGDYEGFDDDGDRSYLYFAWMIKDKSWLSAGDPPAVDPIILAFIPAIMGILSDTAPSGIAPYLNDADMDITHPDLGAIKLMRLREGIERFQITDINNPGGANVAQSNMALMWDDVHMQSQNFNHVPGGGNVLYLDGHVEFIKYQPGMGDAGSPFPICEEWARLADAA